MNFSLQNCIRNERAAQERKIKSIFFFPHPYPLALAVNKSEKSDVSGHRDVTFKPAREGLKEGKQNACREKFTVQFLSNSRANHFNN